MEEILLKLRAPFPVDKLSWRVGRKSNWDNRANKPKNPDLPVKAMMLVYIDSRDVQDRLDEVCGTNWSDTCQAINGRTVFGITINGKTRYDGAGDTDFEAEKGGLSDAFKRAAVKWGIGRYLYNARDYNTWVDVTGMSDFDIYKNNKEYLDRIAMQLGKDVGLYHFYLEKVKKCGSLEELKKIQTEAGIRARDELWNTGNIETFKKNLETKKAELKEKK